MRKLVFAVLLAVVALATPVAADPPLSGSSCTVAPSVVSAGEEYTATGSGLPALRVLNVLILEEQGTQAFSVQTGEDGTAAVTTRSYWPGPKTVEFRAGGHRNRLLASCSFALE